MEKKSDFGSKSDKKIAVTKKYKWLFLCGMGLVSLFVIILVLRFLLIPSISLKGKKIVIINYKESYVEKGFIAKYWGKDVSDKVVVHGKVNLSRLGTYLITYQIKGKIGSRKVVRKVIVKDMSKPVINVDSEDDIYVCPGGKYEGAPYTAFDNYDGDITNKVKVEIINSKAIYTVKDSHGNSRKVVKNIHYEDNTLPEISLNGSNIMYVFVGDNYQESGYSASDNCDLDITDKVSVKGTVDTNVKGEYVLTYEVSDKAGNLYSINRKVIVVERGRPGTIYLTFDDGPKSGTTNVILDILKEEGVEATFFVTNGGPDELIKREYDEGHTVALHTATHDYAIVYASVDAYFQDLNTVSNRVERITGQKPTIIRFPGGSSNTVSRRYSVGIMSILTQEVINRGYRYYDWNVSSGDAAGGSPTPDMIYNNVVNSLSKDRINMVLMHDIKTYTRDALRSIIRYGKENGYTFEKITPATEMVTQRVNN